MNNVNCRLWGKCWGNPANPVRLVVKWAGQQVFDGLVPTSSGQPDAQQIEDHELLCAWAIDNLTTGLVPVEITAHNGSASVNNILLNNVVAGRYVHFKPDLADIGNIYYAAPPRQDINVRTYTDQEFLAQYGFAQDSPPNYVEYVDVAAEDTWVDGNFNRRMKNGTYTDGKLNAKLNGIDFPVLAPPTVEQITQMLQDAGVSPAEITTQIESGNHGLHVPGERNYLVNSGDTLSFDYLIEWDIT